MMRAKAHIGGKNVVVFGLTHENLDRLRADGLTGGIKIDGRELGIDADVWITAADSEKTMLEVFSRAIGPNTKVRIDKRFKS